MFANFVVTNNEKNANPTHTPATICNEPWLTTIGATKAPTLAMLVVNPIPLVLTLVG